MLLYIVLYIVIAYIMLCFVIAYLLLFAALSNAVCMLNAFFAIDLCKFFLSYCHVLVY